MSQQKLEDLKPLRAVEQLEPTQPPTVIPNHMTLAVVATIFFPTGAVAISYANRVKELAAQGEYAQARELAERVRRWSWASIIVGAIFAIVCTYYLVLYALDIYDRIRESLGLPG